MPSDLSLHQRRRLPTEAELDGIPWFRLLGPAERKRAMADMRVSHATPSDLMCRVGKPSTYWFGVIEGLLKMSTDNVQGQTMTYAGLPPGGWFGEGTTIKREPYRYNIQALRKSVVAGLPIDSFHWLLDHSIGFNRFVMDQLNERLAQFIAAREIDRMSSPDLRVARNLAALFNPVLYPAVGQILRITQQSWPTWWVCRASGSTRRWPCWKRKAPSGWNTAVCGCCSSMHCVLAPTQNEMTVEPR